MAPWLLYRWNIKSTGGAPDEITAVDFIQEDAREDNQAARYAV
ncbi:MAG TPA: hypothetical protein VIE90_19800 [Candidatus Binatia bacterium]|jgi:hypothetical protein